MNDFIDIQERPSLGKLLPLSFQHLFAMFGSTVLVPYLLKVDPATALFMNGIGTLLYLFVCKGKIPAYLGSSFAFIAPIMEELIFRGFGTAFFFKNNQKVLPAIVTSVVFTLPHITQLTEFPIYFALGLVLYLSYARRGNIKDSMLV